MRETGGAVPQTRWYSVCRGRVGGIRDVVFAESCGLKIRAPQRFGLVCGGVDSFNEGMKFLGIVLFSVLAAVAYGVVHDQITAHLCVEYFTIGHPQLIDSDSPVVLGLFWGGVGTWWVGAGLGVMLAATSRVGRWPKLEWKDHRRGMAWLLGVIAFLALMAGVAVAGALMGHDPEEMVDFTGAAVPPQVRRLFLVDAAVHLASYGAGFVGGLVLVVQTVLRRRRVGG